MKHIPTQSPLPLSPVLAMCASGSYVTMCLGVICFLLIIPILATELQRWAIPLLFKIQFISQPACIFLFVYTPSQMQKTLGAQALALQDHVRALPHPCVEPGLCSDHALCHYPCCGQSVLHPFHTHHRYLHTGERPFTLSKVSPDWIW